MDSVNLLKMGNYDEIKSKIDGAMKAGADTDIGHEYKKDVVARYTESARHTISTGWDVIDDLMDDYFLDIYSKRNLYLSK